MLERRGRKEEGLGGKREDWLVFPVLLPFNNKIFSDRLERVILLKVLFYFHFL